MFESRGFLKLSEEDHWENGCDPDTSQTTSNDDITFTSDTPEDLIEQLMGFCATSNKDSVMLNSCEDIGRVDIQLMENEFGYAASRAEIEDWKLGNVKLYAVTYSFRVENVERERYKFLLKEGYGGNDAI